MAERKSGPVAPLPDAASRAAVGQSVRRDPEDHRYAAIGLHETVQFQKVDGLWFRMEYRPAEPDELVPDRWGKLVRASELGYPARVIERKQQCDHKTIRRIAALTRIPPGSRVYL